MASLFICIFIERIYMNRLYTLEKERIVDVQTCTDSILNINEHTYVCAGCELRLWPALCGDQPNETMTVVIVGTIV